MRIRTVKGRGMDRGVENIMEMKEKKWTEKGIENEAETSIGTGVKIDGEIGVVRVGERDTRVRIGTGVEVERRAGANNGMSQLI